MWTIISGVLVGLLILGLIIGIVWRKRKYAFRCPSCDSLWKPSVSQILYVGIIIGWGRRSINCPYCGVAVGVEYVKAKKGQTFTASVVEESKDYRETMGDLDKIKKFDELFYYDEDKYACDNNENSEYKSRYEYDYSDVKEGEYLDSDSYDSNYGEDKNNTEYGGYNAYNEKAKVIAERDEYKAFEENNATECDECDAYSEGEREVAEYEEYDTYYDEK